MQVKFTGDNDSNDGVCSFNRHSETTGVVSHFNNDDGHYYYEYKVSGTKVELDIIEEFCAKLSGYYGKKNPYLHLGCVHQYVALTPSQANEGQKDPCHPGIVGFEIKQCQICEDRQEPTFHGYRSCWHETDLNAKKIVVEVPCMHNKKVPAHITKEYDRYYYVSPAKIAKLNKMGLKATGGGVCSGDGNKVYFEYRY